MITDTAALKTLLSATSGGDIRMKNGSLTGYHGRHCSALEMASPAEDAYSAKVIVGSSYIQKSFAAETDEAYVTLLFKMNSVPSSTGRLLVFLNGSTTEGEIALTSSSKLRLRNNGATVGSDSSTLTAGKV